MTIPINQSLDPLPVLSRQQIDFWWSYFYKQAEYPYAYHCSIYTIAPADEPKPPKQEPVKSPRLKSESQLMQWLEGVI